MAWRTGTGIQVRRFSLIGTAMTFLALIVSVAAVPSITAATPTGTYQKCTDEIDYAGDPRPNVEINLSGEQLGECPQPIS
ncbi:hypothetical protein ABZ942_00040 [Nocardia sp. NPDC046473]|uniref:hypothetical protein n=1 Tax=Nocardia sp. NPDC046473 TaxID=3155733 RepID=UPI0033CE60F8